MFDPSSYMVTEGTEIELLIRISGISEIPVIVNLTTNDLTAQGKYVRTYVHSYIRIYTRHTTQDTLHRTLAL